MPQTMFSLVETKPNYTVHLLLFGLLNLLIFIFLLLAAINTNLKLILVRTILLVFRALLM